MVCTSAIRSNRDNTAKGPTSSAEIPWPPKRELFGVQVSVTDYDQAVECLIAAAHARRPAIASFTAAHAVVTFSGDERLRSMANSFEIVAPDGQPVRWALNLLHRAKLVDRVYGPELMLRLCRRCAQEGVPVFLYGGTETILECLTQRLCERFPDLQIAGRFAPPFRPLTDEEDRTVMHRIRDSGARIVLVGLGAPKQDIFAFEHRDGADVVWVCVGAAFDFHAGVKQMAPPWMQRRGLEWLFRMSQEPRRLWRRYAVTNTLFLWKLARAWPQRHRLRQVVRTTCDEKTGCDEK